MCVCVCVCVCCVVLCVVLCCVAAQTYSNLRGLISLPNTLPGNMCAKRAELVARKNAAKNSPAACGMLAGPLYTCIASVMGGSSS